jgi:hypothetical protein
MRSHKGYLLSKTIGARQIIGIMACNEFASGFFQTEI